MKALEMSYPQGNVQLLTMIKSKTFDKVRALHLMRDIPDINGAIIDLDGCSSTYLFVAQSYNNIEAVRFLLENGADPNLCDIHLNSWCALDDLHFLWEWMSDELELRLEIAQLFFEFGGDPNLPVDGETIFDHVLWEVFNDEASSHNMKYLLRFFMLLIAYGGGSGESYCPKPQLIEAIDIKRINEYELKFVPCKDGHHKEGHLFNPDGVDIGVI